MVGSADSFVFADISGQCPRIASANRETKVTHPNSKWQPELQISLAGPIPKSEAAVE